MTRTLLVAGTASHVGKSTVAAGICRVLSDRGVDVAPFKAQNMSNNARAVLAAGDVDVDWGEIGVSQYVQARAARATPTTDCNPVLLKPRGDGESQLVVQGEAVGHFEAGEYYRDHWDRVRDAAEESYRRLATSHDVVVAEGAGSVAEPNLRHRDLANVETARVADADVLLVADIERGGAFASIVGTLELAPEDVADRVVGVVITKFRGDRSILDPAIEEVHDRTGVPVLGVLPHDDPGLPAEDSVSLPDGEGVRGDDDVPPDRTVTVGVPRLPRVSNFTDLEPLARVPGVRVAYRPLSASLADVDAVVVPGTKNTVDDLLALREAGFDAELAAFDGPMIGVCGGYQLLGDRIANAHVEGTGDRRTVAGIGRLPVATTFTTDKRVEAVTVDASGAGPLAGLDGEVSGYEIHMGDTRALRAVDRPVGPQSAAVGSVAGTYLHGLFENRTVREAFVDAVYESADKARPERGRDRRTPYDAAAALVRDHVDTSALLPGA
ncbi:cobyric acid synthase [Haloplanus pelagicus]|jgi:adenosylcobyric acid synthase|uniref:cobyric acid synthase n=1 Tax=Haloplanus pelagicus TaxID=2949995 RepID=UPI00203F36FF|nr:cobyric acid synthase [Haloplanus sp. HW8-1]